MSFGMGGSAWDTGPNPNGGHRTYARLISSWQMSRFGAVPGSAFVFSFLLSFPSSISLSKTHRPDRHRRTARIRARNASHPGSTPQAARPCKAARGRFLSRIRSAAPQGQPPSGSPKTPQAALSRGCRRREDGRNAGGARQNERQVSRWGCESASAFEGSACGPIEPADAFAGRVPRNGVHSL